MNMARPSTADKKKRNHEGHGAAFSRIQRAVKKREQDIDPQISQMGADVKKNDRIICENLRNLRIENNAQKTT